MSRPAAGGGGGGAVAAAGGGGGGAVEFGRIDESDPRVVEMKAKQDALVKSAVEQIETELQKRKVFKNTDDHLKRVASQLVATDQLMGPYNLAATDAEFDLVIDANTDIVLQEMKSPAFALKFAKRFFDTSNPTDSELLNIACTALKTTAKVGSTIVMAAECYSRASTITRIFNATLGAAGWRHFIVQLGSFMSNPEAANYEEFKLNNPIAFGILSRVADVTTKANFIFVAHLCLSRWANPEPEQVAAAAAPPPPPGGMGGFGGVVDLGRKTVRAARSAAGSVLNNPTSCLMGFGWDLKGVIADRVDNGGVMVVVALSSYLQKKDTSFQKVATLTQTAMRFGDCFDRLGLNPGMVSVCIMSLRSKRRQDILNVLVSKGKTMEEATEMLERVYPESSFECPTRETLELLQEEFPDGHQAVALGDSMTAMASSPQADFIARLRQLRIEEQNWEIVDWLMEIAADHVRMLSEEVVAPGLSQMGVALVRNTEPAAKVNPLLMRQDLAGAVSRMLPQEALFNRQCESAREYVVRELMKNGTDEEDAKKAADNCKKHFQWAYSNRRELVLTDDGKLVYKLVSEPRLELEAELRQYNYKILGIPPPQTLLEFFWSGLKKAGAAVGGAVVMGWEHISGNRPSAADDEGCKLLQSVLAHPPPLISFDIAADAAAVRGAAAGGGAHVAPKQGQITSSLKFSVKKPATAAPVEQEGPKRPGITFHVRGSATAPLVVEPQEAIGEKRVPEGEGDDVPSGTGSVKSIKSGDGGSSDDEGNGAGADGGGGGAAGGVQQMEVGKSGQQGAKRGGGNLSSKKSGSKSRKNTKRTRRHNKGRKSSKAAKKTQQRRSSRHRRSSRKGRK